MAQNLLSTRPRGRASSRTRICGETLARAHARWGDRIAIASYLGKGDSFDEAVATFSASYADQNERDYEALAKAVASGRVAAEEGLWTDRSRSPSRRGRRQRSWPEPAVWRTESADPFTVRRV
jgi:hypothetical protein